MLVSWINRFQFKGGQWVYEPSPISRQQGNLIVNELNQKWKKPFYFYHFKNGGHIQAIKSVIHNDFYATLDIKSFFPSISRSRITRTLKSFFDYQSSRRIAKESTLKHPIPNQHSHSLPYGFVQSPLLASVCLHKSTLGLEMDNCFKSKEVTIAVYMDDIILSSGSQDILKAWVDRLKLAAVKSKLQLNEAKESTVATKATAFNIEFSKNQMLITPERFKKLKNTYVNSLSDAQRKGIEGYVSTVNLSQATLLDL